MSLNLSVQCSMFAACNHYSVDDDDDDSVILCCWNNEYIDDASMKMWKSVKLFKFDHLNCFLFLLCLYTKEIHYLHNMKVKGMMFLSLYSRTIAYKRWTTFCLTVIFTHEFTYLFGKMKTITNFLLLEENVIHRWCATLNVNYGISLFITCCHKSRNVCVFFLFSA